MERHEESLTGNGGVNISYQTWTPTVPPRGILVISHWSLSWKPSRSGCRN